MISVMSSDLSAATVLGRGVMFVAGIEQIAVIKRILRSLEKETQ